jgi:hypothetical protein
LARTRPNLLPLFSRSSPDTVILLTLNLAAAVWLFSGNATEISAFNAQLISAVAFQGVVIWLAVLGFSFLFARIPCLPPRRIILVRTKTNRLSAEAQRDRLNVRLCSGDS